MVWCGEAGRGTAGISMMTNPQWYGESFQAAKAARMEFAKNKCEACRDGGVEYVLECHHKDGRAYQNSESGFNDIDDVIILCKPCHEAITDVIRRRRDLKTIDLTPMPSIIGSVAKSSPLIDFLHIHNKPVS